MRKTALIIRHSSSIHLGTLSDIIAHNNYEIKQIDIFKDDVRALNPIEHDIVIVLGGVFGAYNHSEYPFIAHEIDFLKKRINADKPTLGICLGAQMIAAALGAGVYQGGQGFELGWGQLSITEAGENTSIKHFDPSRTQMYFSHADTFDLPKDAILLASSDKYKNQAFIYGKNILATQFHPEVSANLIEELLGLLASQLTGAKAIADIHEIRKDTDKYIQDLEGQTSKFMNEWLQDIEGLGNK